MRREVTYYAFDGKKFDTEMECYEYEENHRDFLKIRGAIDTLKNYCRKSYCVNCPFFSSLQGCRFKLNTPNEWEV